MGQDETEREAKGSGRLGRLAELGPGWISAIAGLIAAFVAVAGLMIASHDGSGTTDSAGAANEASAEGGQVLPPATTPARVELCEEQLEFAADNTVAPLTCVDGGLNVLAWRHYSQPERFVMSVGPEAGPVQVGRAMCSDWATVETTIPEETEAYKVASIYNSWDFALDPSELFPDNC